jgi:hypothetical protein
MELLLLILLLATGAKISYPFIFKSVRVEN